MTHRELIGEKFGRLAVMEHLGLDKGHHCWKCICDCGNEFTCTTGRLTSGNTQSCGCIKREFTGKLNKTHGKSKTPEYQVWKGMIKRCENENCRAFPDYGGRGIAICDEWRESFEKFLEDMGSRPSARHSIDRINADGNYEPGNCRWAIPVTQARNRRCVSAYTHDGKTQCLSAWAEELGLPYSSLNMRLQRGWDFALAISTPFVVGQKVRNSTGGA